MNKDIHRILKEAFAGGELSPATNTPLVKYSDTPFIKDLIEFCNKQKDFQLINIIGNGDMWQMDLRGEIAPEGNAQYTREIAKAKAYDILNVIKKFIDAEGSNIPNLSIQGIKSVENKVEFTVSFIYAYKNNQRDLYENKAQVKNLLTFIFNNLK